MTKPELTITDAAEYEQIIKGSRFIARVRRVENVAEAQERLEPLSQTLVKS
jgi:putative IMPACT (imprinted ancient) family translation regulator